MHWRLILNGKSVDDEDVRDAVAAMRGRGVDLGVRVTWEAGDAGRYVAEAMSDGVATVVAAGGDGTLSEVAAAMAAEPADADELPSLGLVPLGTANDFAAAAGLPEEPLAALELIHGARAQAVDLLRVDDGDSQRWAVNLASGGFGTEVTVETREGLKEVLGGLAYLVTGMSKLGRIEPIEAHVVGTGFAWRGGFIALGLGNGRQAGGGQALCPEAVIDDGLLDVTIVPELDGEMAAALATMLREGRHAALARVATTTRLPWVEIAATRAFTLNLDGEPVEGTRFRVECVPRRLRMHLSPGCPLLGTPGNPIAAGLDDSGSADLPGLQPA
jgi:lipid kinase YegS